MINIMKNLIFSITTLLLLSINASQAQQNYKIGDQHPLGGIVFKVADNGKSGLIAASKNSPGPTKSWDAAKQYCKSLGKEWYMPSKEEMRTMVTNLTNGDLKSRYFWTSTEKGTDDAYIVLLQNGILNWPTTKSGGKNYVRPIRAFSAADKAPVALKPPKPKPNLKANNTTGALSRKRLSATQTLGNQTLTRGTQLYYAEGAGIPNCIFEDTKGRIFIGGNFHFTHEGKAFDNLAVWEKDQWTTFSSSQGEQKALGEVADIVEDSKNNIYVLSKQVDTNYKDENSVRKWDGTKWTTIGILNGGLVNELAIGLSDELYVCGSFGSISSKGRKSSISGSAKYQNGSWQKVSSVALTIYDIAVNSKGELYGLTGHGNVVSASGGRWRQMVTDYISSAYDLGFDSQDNLYVTGYFGLTHSTDSKGRSIVNDKDAQGNATYYSNVAKYDGQKWTNLNGGLKKTYDGLAIDGSDVYFISTGSPTKKWDGQQFTEIDLNANYVYEPKCYG